MLKEFLDKKDPKALYPAHFYGRKREFIHIERLANLDKFPNSGFKVICFPVKIKNTGAAWARVVAHSLSKRDGSLFCNRKSIAPQK